LDVLIFEKFMPR